MVLGMGVEHHILMLDRNRGVTGRIHASDHHLHIIIAFIQRMSRDRYFVTQLAVGIRHHVAVIFMAIDADHHMVTRLRITAHNTGNHRWHAGFAGVDGVVTRYGIDSDGVMRLGVQHHGFVLDRNRGVTGCIHTGDHYLYVIVAFIQRCRRHRHFIAQLAVGIRHHVAVIFMAVNADDDFIARLRITAHNAGDQGRHTRFAGVNGVIASNRFDGQGITGLGVQHHRGVLNCRGGVTGIVSAGDHHLHIVAAFVQGRRRHRYFVTQLAVFIGHRAVEVLAVNADHHMVACMCITGYLSADERWHTGFAGVDGVVTRHRFDSQGVMRLGVQHHGFVLYRNRGVTGGIHTGDHHLYVIVAFIQCCRRHRHFIAQLAVGIDHNLAVEIMPVDADHHVVTHLRITGYLSADECWHTGFAGVDGVVASDRFDSQGIMCLGIEHHVLMLNHNRGVTGCIHTGDHHLHVVAAFVQRRRRHRHFITQLTVGIRHHVTAVFMAVNADDDFIAHLRITAHHAGDHRRHPGLGGIHHIVTGHGLDDHMVLGMGVEHHVFVLGRNRGVTGRVNTGDHHLHIIIAFIQRRGWYRHFIAQLAIFIRHHVAAIFMAVDADHHMVTHLRITGHHSADERRHTAFGGVDGVVTRHGVDSQGIAGLGIQYQCGVLNCRGGVTGCIHTSDHHLHIIIAFAQCRRRHRYGIAQLAVFIGHHAIEILAVDADHHVVTHLRITGHLSADECWHTGLGCVDGVVTRHRFDGQGIMCQGIEHHVLMLNHNRGVTGCIHTGDHHLHIVIAFVQGRRRHRHFITQLTVFIGHHITAVFMTIHADDDFIARLRITAHHAGDHRRHPGFDGIHHIVTGHGLDDHMVLGMGVEHHVLMLNRNRGVTGCIHTGDHHLHVVAAFVQRMSRDRYFIAQLAVGIRHHLAAVFMAIHADDDFITRLRITAHHARDHRRHPGFSGIHHIVTGHGLNDHMVLGMGVEDHVFVLDRNRGVTGRVHAGDHHLYVVTTFIQRRSWYRHFIAQLAVFIGHHVSAVFMAIYADDDFIAHLRIPAHHTRDHRRHPGFGGIHHIVTGHGLDDHMILGMGVEHHIFVLDSRGGITGIVSAGDHHLHIVAAFGQGRRRHRYFVTQLAVFISHRAIEILAVDADHHMVACMCITGYFTADKCRHTGFSTVDDVVSRHGFNSQGVMCLRIQYYCLVFNSNSRVANIVDTRDHHLYIVAAFIKC